MDHEDNTQFANNYLRGNMDDFSLQQNQQNLVENRQIASGFGTGGIVGVVDEIGLSIGGKFEEEHDEEEWKYIQEEQQTEKQQVMKVGEVRVLDGVGRLADFEADGGDSGELLQTAVMEDEEEAAVIKNDGDFSTTSNTTSTTVGEEDNMTVPDEEPQEIQQQMEAIVQTATPAVGLERTQFLAQDNYSSVISEEGSLAIGENCENSQQYRQHEPHHQLEEPQMQQHLDDLHEQSEKISGCMFSSSSPFAEDIKDGKHEKYEEDKENADPAFVRESPAAAAAVAIGSPDYTDIDIPTHKDEARPSKFDVEVHSNLNADAKEFIPISANIMSPNTLPKSQDILEFGDPSFEQKNQLSFEGFGVGCNKGIDVFVSNTNISDGNHEDGFRYISESATSISPHPNVPLHLVIAEDVDDVLAQSPRKGRGSDMDAISLPPENEFEHEAAKRPHEIEHEDDDDDDGDDLTVDSYRKRHNDVVADMNGMEMGNIENAKNAADCGDMYAENFMQTSDERIENCSNFPNLLDHGPETSVDLDMDSQNIMTQSFYAEDTNTETQSQFQMQEQPIEEVLNSVQPIPGASSDSLNSSFTEDLANVGNKELLYIEEKEAVSNSPSTEELQYQFHRDLDTFESGERKLENETNTQESSNVEQIQNPSVAEAIWKGFKTEDDNDFANFEERSGLSSFEGNTIKEESYPIECFPKFNDNNDLLRTESVPARDSASEEVNQFTDFLSNDKVTEELVESSQPNLIEEKHLMEDNKEYDMHEQHYCDQKMDDLLLVDDGNVRKVQDVAQSAIPIIQQVASSDEETEDYEAISPEPEPEFIQKPIHEQHGYDYQVLSDSEEQNRNLSSSPSVPLEEQGNEKERERNEEDRNEEERNEKDRHEEDRYEDDRHKEDRYKEEYNIRKEEMVEGREETVLREVSDEIGVYQSIRNDFVKESQPAVEYVHAEAFELSLTSEKISPETNIHDAEAVSSPVHEVEAIKCQVPEVQSTSVTTEPSVTHTECLLLPEDHNPFVSPNDAKDFENGVSVEGAKSLAAEESHLSVLAAANESFLFDASYQTTESNIDELADANRSTPQLSPAEDYLSKPDETSPPSMPKALTLQIGESLTQTEPSNLEPTASVPLDEAPTPEVEAPLIITKIAPVEHELPVSKDVNSSDYVSPVQMIDASAPITEATEAAHLIFDSSAPYADFIVPGNQVPASSFEASVIQEVPASTVESSITQEVPASANETSLTQEVPASANETSLTQEVPVPTVEASVTQEATTSVTEPTHSKDEIQSPKVVKDDDVGKTILGVAAATVGVAAAAASVAAVTATTSTSKKLEPASKINAGKKTLAGAKLKPVSDSIKKSADNKKPTTTHAAKPATSTGASKPRTVPSVGTNKTSQTGRSIEKKTSTNTTEAGSATKSASPGAIGRKPISSNITTTKTSSAAAATATTTKMGTTRPITQSGSSKSAVSNVAKSAAATKSAAPRLGGTTARKPTSSNTAPTAPSAHGSAAKPRLSNGATAAAKPTTLSIPTKPKPALSPRARPLSSQFTKPTGSSTAFGSAAKSPTKSSAISMANGNKKSPSTTNSTTANRTKTTAPTTTTSAATTKTFTARPAPNTVRRSFGGTSTRTTTTVTTTNTTNSSLQRKSSPSKPKSTTAGGVKASPTKTNASKLIKTKEVTTTSKAAIKTTTQSTVVKVLKEKQMNMSDNEPLQSSAKINGGSLHYIEESNGQLIVETGSSSSHEGANGMIEQKDLTLMDGGTVA